MSFYRSQKFLGRPKSFMPVRNLIAFSATPKKIVSALKLNLLNAKILGPAHLHNQWWFNIDLKFIYSEKATKIWPIFQSFLLHYLVASNYKWKMMDQNCYGLLRITELWNGVKKGLFENYEPAKIIKIFFWSRKDFRS